MDKFLTLFSNLSSIEKEDFLIFLDMSWQSPIDSGKPISKKMRIILKDLVLGFNSAIGLSQDELKSKIWEQLFPSHRYDVRLLSDAFSPAIRSLELFIVLNRIREEMHIDEFRYRLEVSKYKTHKIRQIAEKLEAILNLPLPPFSTEIDLEIRYSTLRELYNSATRSRDLIRDLHQAKQYYASLEEAVSELFYLRNIRWECAAISEAAYSGSQFNLIRFPFSFKREAIGRMTKRNKVIQCFTIIRKILLSKAASERELKSLMASVASKDFKVNSPEFREVFRFILKFCMQAESNEIFYDKPNPPEYTGLYCKGIESGFLVENEILPFKHLLNCCTLLAKSGKTTAARTIFTHYSDQIEHEELLKGSDKYCSALILYYEGKFRDSWSELQQYNPSGISKIGFYVLSIKIQFELNPDIVEGIVNTFEKWMKNWELPWFKSRIASERKRLLLIRRILRIQKGRTASIKRLAKDILNSPIDHEWLQQKFYNRFRIPIDELKLK